MRFFALVLAFVAYANAESTLEDIYARRDLRAFEGTIRDIAECIRNILNTGIPELGHPHFNPLLVAAIDFDLSILGNPELQGTVKFTNLEASGLTGFDLFHVDGSIGIIPPAFTLAYGLNFPRVVVKSTYELKGTSSGKEIASSGTLEIEIGDFKLDGSVKIKVIGFHIDHFNVYVALGASKLQMVPASDDGGVAQQLSEAITNKLPALVEANREQLSQWLSNLVMGSLGRRQARGYIQEIVNRCKP